MKIQLTDPDRDDRTMNGEVADQNWVQASIDAGWAYLQHTGADAITVRSKEEPASGETGETYVRIPAPCRPLTIHDAEAVAAKPHRKENTMGMTATQEEFFSDVITTAIEGGVGYWSQCSQYQWVDEREGNRLRVVVGQRVPEEGTRATIEDMEDDNREYHVTPSVIWNGILKITKREAPVNDTPLRLHLGRSRATSTRATSTPTAADAIVQAGPVRGGALWVSASRSATARRVTSLTT